MDPRKETIPYIEKNIKKYGIERINKERQSEDFKLLIFGLKKQGKQIGIYDRTTTVIRLEHYEIEIKGVEVLHKCAKSSAAESSFSNFKKNRGVCVKVHNIHALEYLFDWYFNINVKNTHTQSNNSKIGINLYMPDCGDLENTYRKHCKPNETITEKELFELFEEITTKKLTPGWRDKLKGRCF